MSRSDKRVPVFGEKAGAARRLRGRKNAIPPPPRVVPLPLTRDAEKEFSTASAVPLFSKRGKEHKTGAGITACAG